MPYRRHLRCPLLTTHGHILMLLHEKGPLRRKDIAAGVGRADTTVGRLLRELHGDNLIGYDRTAGGTWWHTVSGYSLIDRLITDRK